MNKGKVCISIRAKTADELFERVAKAEPLSDVIELRFDHLDPAQVDSALDGLPKISKQYLITYRPSEQGGHRVLPLSARLMFWKRAVRALQNHDFLVDHEADIDFPFGFDPQRTIVSQHFFSDSPSDLRSIYFTFAETSGGIVKIAADCPEITDTLKVWRLLESARIDEGEVIPIAMGEAGKWTRILGPAYGAFMTYAALDAVEATAPGQIAAADMIDVFRVKELDRETKVYGIVAGDTSYSISPWMHNAGFGEAGLNRVFVPLQVANIDEFIRRMVRPDTREMDLNFAGFSVTNPHKQAIIQHLDEIDETAAKIGAVNTVKIEDGKFQGFNTDAPGFIAPLKQLFGDLKDASIGVAGAGGAARACVYALKQEGADVSIFARDRSKAAILAEEFEARVGETGWSGLDVLVNCTPLGTKGGDEDGTVATAEDLNGVQLVYDLVYNPTETRLIREAKKAGVPAIGGIDMLIAQGARQFEIWTGSDAPVDAMAAAVKKKLNL